MIKLKFIVYIIISFFAKTFISQYNASLSGFSSYYSENKLGQIHYSELINFLHQDLPNVTEKILIEGVLQPQNIPIKEIIVIQNGISPNGDNINDKWGINNIINTGIYYNVRIFNKWGGILYTSSYPDIVEWDGKFNGSYVPAADYYYLISFKETNQNYSGTITVKY
tara:strand:- start:2655 stop:3155 length:501 start_codon:yes stop_codon:yes gene_type:complete